MTTGHPYLMANAATQAGDRFRALSALFDAETFLAFERAGIGSGWKCWEAGAGGPAVPAGMAARCAPGGHVLATDIDLKWLEGSGGSFEIREHNVATEAPPRNEFDLAHARLVLSHVPARDKALANMMASLKPGGVLIIEDFDIALAPLACIDPQTEADHRANRIRGGFVTLLEQRGVDRAYGRKLDRLMREAGLTNVTVSARIAVGGEAGRMLDRANVSQTAQGLMAIGAATEESINAHLRALDDAEFQIAFPVMFTVTGRKN